MFFKENANHSINYGRLVKFIFAALVLPLFLFTCNDNPFKLGMDEPIDFESPVLTLDPIGHPYYVTRGAKLSGTVTDNIAVKNVILRDTDQKYILYRNKEDNLIYRKQKEQDKPDYDENHLQIDASLLTDDRWEISLDFTEKDNGTQIIAEIVAFDHVDNSGDSSIRAITIIIDIREPLVKDRNIKRTDTRTSDLEEYSALIKLETEDPLRQISANANKYQNGRFYINAFLEEEETGIDDLKLSIYDAREPDTLILQPEIVAGTSNYAPSWLIDEKDILDGGVAVFGSSYRSNYLAGVRYYYRVVITAYDKSKNRNIVEDQGFFCLWDTSDNPVGIVDTKAVGEINPITITSGSSIPIIIFDDDKLSKAYAGLFTEEQWAGTKEIYTGIEIPTGTEQQKLEFLRDRLLAGDPVYNWRFDSYSGTYNTYKDYNITDQVGTNDLEELIYYVQTGNSEADHGTYVLVIVTQDLKTDPSNIDPAYPVRTSMQKYTVNVIDENVPLIVFDTDAGSPEENTFPKLVNGKYFTIKGYTLRENKSGTNQVEKFRIAWIPARTPGGADSLINDVQQALRNGTGYPSEVQYWDFSDIFSDLETYTDWENEDISGAGDIYRRQNFSKKFNILGELETFSDPPDNEPAHFSSYRFFHSTCDGECNLPDDEHIGGGKGEGQCRENATKLFIFYAQDSVGHEVFRQLRLLGNRTPPVLNVYDITPVDITLTGTPPDIYYYSPQGDYTTPAYHTARNTFNSANYNNIKTVFYPFDDKDLYRSVPLQNYPRGSTVKYWISASLDGDLGIADISMTDITDTVPVKVGTYTAADKALSYVELFPEVTQRSFLIEATDTLGNVARIQRTMAISSRARLTSITTNLQNGSYPAGAEVEIKANFDGLIRLASDDNGKRPKLNIIFDNSATVDISGQANLTKKGEVIQIECEPLGGSETLSLTFRFIVPPLALGQVETMYNGHPDGEPQDSTNRPLSLFDDDIETILDHNRNDPAFTPTNTIGFDWTNNRGALQYDAVLNPGGKEIILDGTPPSITGIATPLYLGKNAAVVQTGIVAGSYYFKNNDTLYLAIKANEDIKTNGTPVLAYTITPRTGAAYERTTGFTYQRPGADASEMVFRLDINRDNIPTDGRLTRVRLLDAATITDIIGNTLVASTVTDTAFGFGTTGSTYTSAYTGYANARGISNIYFDLTPPGCPGTNLNGIAITSGADTLYYNTGQTLSIDELAESDTNKIHDNEPIKREYSVNGGLAWTEYTGDVPLAGNFNNTLMTRYVDTAGNTSGENPVATEREFSRPVQINTVFPTLTSVGMVNPAGTYTTKDTTPTLTFRLNFAEPVSVGDREANVSITLTNRKESNTHNSGGTANSYQITLYATTGQNNTTSVNIPWTLAANTKEMLDGLYISAMTITGLRDTFTNVGPSVSIPVFNDTTHALSSPQITVTGQTAINNLNTGIIIDTIPPRIETRVPDIEGILAGTRNTITLTFSEPMMKGNGTITVRPRGNYAVPAVFENSGYYLGVDGTRYASPGTNRTYVQGFYDVYNAAGLDATDRNYLTLSTGNNWNTLVTNVRTGREVGPYVRITHGLRPSTNLYGGYTGNYNNTAPDLPNPDFSKIDDDRYLLPDTATKWVLDYQYYNLYDSEAGAVNNIRNVLTKAKWRWQQIDVGSLPPASFSGNSVTITLNEPLLEGLQWEVYYPEGTFTDKSGYDAPSQGTADPSAIGAVSAYWFWTNGVQTPVIRVNRRSYDARVVGTVTSGGDHSTLTNLTPSGTLKSYPDTPPAETTNWAENGPNAEGRNGWGINDFNTIHYRISSETPNATFTYGTYSGTTAERRANKASVNAGWTGSVHDANASNQIDGQDRDWNHNANTTNAQWILTNLVRRRNSNYTVKENNTATDVTRIYANGSNGYNGFRSYNKDMTIDDMKNVVLEAFTGTNNQGNIVFEQLEAGKAYVVAQASVTRSGTVTEGAAVNASERGYEGVFRTVIALLHSTDTQTSRATFVEGSNVKNGMPSVAGFPVRDAEETGDNRYIKMFYRNTARQLLWVSTEIVCEWFFLKWGGTGTGSTHMSAGEVNNYMTVGYGDLTYGYNISSSGD